MGPVVPRLEQRLADALAVSAARVVSIEPLAGGTLQEHWRFTARLDDGKHESERSFVLRASGPTSVMGGLSREQEFRVMQTVQAAGVTVPSPICYFAPGEVVERDCFAMEFAPGIAAPTKIVRQPHWRGQAGEDLARRIGLELARMQTVRPGNPGVDFLALPASSPADHLVETFKAFLEKDPAPHPAIEWGVRFLALNAPRDTEYVLTHGDFRTGNYLVDENGLTALLDWELAAWGHPLQDLCWFCMKFFRFGENGREAGGIADRKPFFEGYEKGSGRTLDPRQVHYWDIAANVRWAIISIQQTDRHLCGRPRSLELALTGRCTAEMEHEALRLIRDYEHAR